MNITGYFLSNTIENKEQVLSFFENYNQKNWDYCSGGCLKFIDESEEITLIIQKKIKNSDISLTYTRKALNDNRPPICWHSLGDKELLNDFIDVGEHEFASLGTFICFQKALDVIEVIFQFPNILPSNINWILSEKIDWDKLYNENF